MGYYNLTRWRVLVQLLYQMWFHCLSKLIGTWYAAGIWKMLFAQYLLAKTNRKCLLSAGKTSNTPQGYICSPALSQQFILRDVDYLCLPLIHYIDDITGNETCSVMLITARSSNYSGLIDKTLVCQRVGNKFDKNSGAVYLSGISRIPVAHVELSRLR